MNPTAAAAVPVRARVAWLIWTVGVAAYILTVMQRTTLAAAGLDAADRFGLSPGTLAAFVFIQVAVFSLAQLPAGLMVDRFGPRAMLVANAVLMAAGQLLLAHATTMPVAARVALREEESRKHQRRGLCVDEEVVVLEGTAYPATCGGLLRRLGELRGFVRTGRLNGLICHH